MDTKTFSTISDNEVTFESYGCGGSIERSAESTDNNVCRSLIQFKSKGGELSSSGIRPKKGVPLPRSEFRPGMFDLKTFDVHVHIVIECVCVIV